jgi:hypothetical protein
VAFRDSLDTATHDVVDSPQGAKRSWLSNTFAASPPSGDITEEVRAEHEREKLLQAYFAEAMPLDLFKREQNRIAKEIDLAQAEIKRAEATDSPYGQLLETALGIIRNAREGYSAADPYVKRLWNRALMERIEIGAGQVARVELKEPFAGLFLWAASNKGRLVEEGGFEPPTTCPPSQRIRPRSKSLSDSPLDHLSQRVSPIMADRCGQLGW